MSTNPYQAPSAPTLTAAAGGLADAPKGKRFLNLVIDYIFFILIATCIGFAIGASGKVTAEEIEAASSTLTINLISCLIWLLYYIVMEHSMGATVGKMVTGTRVVSQDGGKPTLGQIVGRSFARLIPFEVFSFLGSGPGGWHDTMSKTRVVLKR